MVFKKGYKPHGRTKMIKKHKCPNCGTETEVDFETNRRICPQCGWYGDIVGGQTVMLK